MVQVKLLCARLMAGILEPTSGKLIKNGKISCLINTSAGLNPEATRLEKYLFEKLLLGMKQDEIKKIRSNNKFADLVKFIDLPMRTYSSGMISRLSYSISTAIEPDILLIDEGIGAENANFTKK